MTNFCWGLTLYRIINDFGHFSMFGPNTKATTVLFPAVPLLQFCPLLHSRAVLWSVELGKITELPNKTENELIEKSKEAQKEGEKELFFFSSSLMRSTFCSDFKTPKQTTVILYFAKAHFHMRLVMLRAVLGNERKTRVRKFVHGSFSVSHQHIFCRFLKQQRVHTKNSL